MSTRDSRDRLQHLALGSVRAWKRIGDLVGKRAFLGVNDRRAQRLIVALALVLAGCGASAKPHHAVQPEPSQADRMKAVVRGWSANVNAGNSAAEARLFSIPALISMMGGPYGCWCLTKAQVVQWHAQLPCSGEIVWIKVRGRYATAVFRLGERETEISDCVDAGTLTATRFTIVRGKITALEQMWWKPPGRRAIYATRPATPRWARPPRG